MDSQSTNTQHIDHKVIKNDPLVQYFFFFFYNNIKYLLHTLIFKYALLNYYEVHTFLT